MSLAELSIKRPIFITCLVLVMLAVGLLAMQRMPVDLFPDVTFPVVSVTTSYPGAGPSEIETLITKPLEDEMSSLAGIKRLSSLNSEGFSRVVAEFTLETDIKYAEQQVRDRVSATKSKLPLDVKDPVIRRLDPADQPILVLSVSADLPESKLYDLADQTIRTKLEQINQVGLVEIIGGRKREIHVVLDRTKLKGRELSVTGVASRLEFAGENVPSGKVDVTNKQISFRTLGEFKSLEDIKNTVVNFFGSEVPITVGKIGEVIDTLEDEESRAYVNGRPALLLNVYRQTGANTIAVVDAIRKRLEPLNKELQKQPGKAQISMIRDGSKWIRSNVDDVKESIFFGVALAMIVVFFFLGNGRSTIITGLALPNSLIGAFILMAAAGFSINIMTLLALSLSVGLLIDDAIVVRENIFRHIELGENPVEAARKGTQEVQLAVIATTLAVIAVFGPVGFLKGVTGQFFRQFGLTICFAMMISLFDALTIAPMLSAYFAGRPHTKDIQKLTLYGRTVGRLLKGFDHFQSWLEHHYERLLSFTLRRPIIVLIVSFLVFILSSASVKYVPKTFLPPQDAGEFTMSLDMPPGTSLDAMDQIAKKADLILSANPEVSIRSLSVGGQNGKTEVAEFYVGLISSKERTMNTSQFKEKLRGQLKPMAYANPQVKDFDAVSGGQRPFNLNFIGMDQKELEAASQKAFEKIRQHPGLKDVDTSYRPGKPEFQVALDSTRSKLLGISTKVLGSELRAQIQGVTPAKFRELGREYDVRVRLLDSQRNLKNDFNKTYVPNLNGQLVKLSDASLPIETTGPATINRQDRGRLITISADITPGAGIGDVMNDITSLLENQIKLPDGVRYSFTGQAENFQELGSSMVLALGFGVLFIFLVLASLYESFITPLTIMLALPLAICGSFVALLITHESLNIFSMIGTIMLLGIASKNSILLVDYTHQLMEQGMERSEALIRAGKTRLRPILMTTMALIAGTIPVALGLNEASRQRTSMGVSIIGGLISSTLLTLVVVPAAFSYIDRFRHWTQRQFAKVRGH